MRVVQLAAETWEMTLPFRITGHVFSAAHLLKVSISEQGCTGRGEGAGVYYLGEDTESILAQAESVRPAL